MIMIKAHNAKKASDNINTFLRFHRSINTPAKGPIKACGNSADIPAIAKTSAELCSKLNHITIAKLTA